MTITTSQFDPVNVGSAPNDGTGADLRSSFITINSNFSNISSIGFDAANVRISGILSIASVNVPTANNSPGTVGQVVWGNGNIYVCVATNTWMRAALTSSF